VKTEECREEWDCITMTVILWSVYKLWNRFTVVSSTHCFGFLYITNEYYKDIEDNSGRADPLGHLPSSLYFEIPQSATAAACECL
jgi:hypothetical protein